MAEPGGGPAAADWAALGIPVRLAFVFRSTQEGRWLAALPGPVGTVEAELPRDAWARLAEALSIAAELAPDVEALLFHAEPACDRITCLLVPIDACYALAGRLRRVWKGFDGGAEARAEIDAALAALRARARPGRLARTKEGAL
jgi:hypothetical protein